MRPIHLDDVIEMVTTDGVGDIARLVEHTEWVGAGQSTEQVDARFTQHPREYLAVVDDGRVIGLCGRWHVRGLIGGRYGFALHSRDPIRAHLLPTQLVVERTMSLRRLLEQALSRLGEHFYQDVVVVDEAGALIGLVSTQRLVKAQSDLVRDQFLTLETQRSGLETANAALAESLAQQQRLERQVVAKEKASLVETLAGGIAHEINNKLMPIVGYTELLIEDTRGSEDLQIGEYCQIIHTAALESSRIIRQLLQLARPTAHERTDCDLRELVEQGLTLVKLRLHESAVAVTVDMPDQPVNVRVDGPQVKQVIMNLVLNAMDAMERAPERHLTLRLCTVAGTASLAIVDTGCGIPPDRLTRIFDPFFTTKAPNLGTGLGLSVSLSMTRLHGGDIDVESAPGHGATFRMVLPVVEPAEDGTAPLARIDRRHRGDVAALVVEDDDAVGALLMRALESRLGCQVERASDGLEAVAALSRASFHVVISDIRMPRMNGVELLAWIREHRPELLSKLMFITGDASGTPMTVAIDQSGLPTIRKPITVDTLIGRVLDLIDGRRAPAA